jgi:uncharacterized protein YdeI (BOF family)
LNGTKKLLTYADDVSIEGEIIHNIKEDTGVLLDAYGEVRLEVNTERTKYMLTSLSQKIENGIE